MMQSITDEEYEATCKWLKSKIAVDGVVSINDVEIPLEWLLQLVESTRNPEKNSKPMSAEEKFWHIPNVSCYDISCYVPDVSCYKV